MHIIYRPVSGVYFNRKKFIINKKKTTKKLQIKVYTALLKRVSLQLNELTSLSMGVAVTANGINVPSYYLAKICALNS